MTRVMKFDGELGKKMFEMAYEGFILGSTLASNEKGRSIADRRKEASILEKFEAVSVVDPTRPIQLTNDEGRTIQGDVSISFTQPELDMLVEQISCEKIPWKVTLAGRLVSLVDHLVACEKIE